MDYTTYANRFSEWNFGGLVSQNIDQLCEFNIEFVSDTLWIQLSILAESYHSFRQGEGGDTLHNLFISSKWTKKSGLSHQRSCPRSRLFWLRQQQIPAMNAPSVQWEELSLISAPCWTTISRHGLFIKSWWRSSTSSKTPDDFVERVERCSYIFGHFST